MKWSEDVNVRYDQRESIIRKLIDGDLDSDLASIVAHYEELLMEEYHSMDDDLLRTHYNMIYGEETDCE